MNKPRKYGSTCFLTFLRKQKETSMNKLIILSALLLVSCANTQSKRHSWATVKYTVREYYYPIASKPVTVKPIDNVKPIKKPSKPVKKKASRLDCERVFKEVNQCMQK